MHLTPSLAILHVERSDESLIVDMYGGPLNSCVNVVLTYSSPDLLAANLTIIEGWMRTAALVDFESDSDTARIVLAKTPA